MMGSQVTGGDWRSQTSAKNTSKTPLKSQSRPVILRVKNEHARLISAIAILVFGIVFGQVTLMGYPTVPLGGSVVFADLRW